MNPSMQRERIKSALAAGDLAEARRLRSEAHVEALKRIHHLVFTHNPGRDYLVCETAHEALELEEIHIPEETR